MKNRQELEDSFHWWISSIPDFIDQLEEKLPDQIYAKLDGSIDSLEILGTYLIEHETIESLQQKRELWDGLASYVGIIYEKRVLAAKWSMELQDSKNVYYGIPVLRAGQITTFAPHYEITTMLARKQPDFLSVLVKLHIKLTSS